MFVKLGEAIEISRIENAESCIPALDPSVLENFKKMAANLRKIAPRAEDFLYFSAVMMHAAESAALNDDGSPKLTIRGEPVQVGWDKSGGTWRWMSNDNSIKPFKNTNGDIFPEEELIKAYKKWIGKPLCVDHKSASVDHTRGFIVDTYYDRNLKRVIALCALDKVNYPELARKVSTGMQTACSMGTAVGKAICTDCGRVARAEQDFCDHMRRKTCYGEINVDLNPIELSIVVNGADPKAHIKHIIAAANTLNTYVENKAKELNKLADSVFSANLTVRNADAAANATNITIEATDIEKFKADLDDAFQRLSEISASAKISAKDTNDLAFSQSSGTIAMDEETVSGSDDSGLAPPHARFASKVEVGGDAIASLHEVTAAIETKLNQMKQSLEKLSHTNKQEEPMSGSNDMNKQAYFQGTEEPTPGQAKYPKDPLNEKLRESEDKQMVGQPPFPGVGPVDGMHPSPESADPSNELERKKMLARAEAEERAVKRAEVVAQVKKALEEKKANLETKGYFQGGGGVNEPAPGKVRYPIDKLNEEDRENEDKQMVGQKPFPGVGPVDGMHPSPASADITDEKKRKEMLQRASLRARFVKAANEDGTQNLGKSAWEVFQGDKLLLSASVEDLSGGRTEMMYDAIATKEYGAKLIDKVKKEGSEKVSALLKSGQAAPELPPAPMDAAPMAAPEDTGKEGDPKATALELAEKVRDLSSDLVEAVRALTGEQAEMGEMGEMGAAASDEAFGPAALNTFRKELNGALTQAMNETVVSLNDHQQELEMIAGLYDNGAVIASNQDAVAAVVEDALNEAKTAIADGFKLMTAFIKYARGTKAIVKRAEMEAELEALAKGDDTMDTEKDSQSSDDLMSLIQDTNADLDAVKDLMADDNEHFDTSPEGVTKTDYSKAETDANDLMAKPEELKDLNVKPGTEVKVVAEDYSTREGRAALRAKLAADALGKEDDGQIQDMSKAKFSDMLDQADSLADGQTHLDVKPSDALGLVETLPEVNKQMMDVAKAPPKVRKDAEAIQEMIVKGQLDPKDVDELVSLGLDKDAVAYWKKYFGQAEGGSEFASELVKEHAKAQLETELNKFKVKMARAYELAYDMVDRGLCHNDRTTISNQVEEIMQFSDENFQTLKNVVAMHTPMRKAAGKMPLVSGLSDMEDVKAAVSEGNLFEQLSAAFSQTSRKTF